MSSSTREKERGKERERGREREMGKEGGTREVAGRQTEKERSSLLSIASELESSLGGKNWEDFWQKWWNLQESGNTKPRPV